MLNEKSCCVILLALIQIVLKWYQCVCRMCVTVRARVVSEVVRLVRSCPDGLRIESAGDTDPNFFAFKFLQQHARKLFL